MDAASCEKSNGSPLNIVDDDAEVDEDDEEGEGIDDGPSDKNTSKLSNATPLEMAGAVTTAFAFASCLPSPRLLRLSTSRALDVGEDDDGDVAARELSLLRLCRVRPLSRGISSEKSDDGILIAWPVPDRR
jgi:hypothetical protein